MIFLKSRRGSEFELRSGPGSGALVARWGPWLPGSPLVFSPTAPFPVPWTHLLFGFLLESASWRLIFHNGVRMVVFFSALTVYPASARLLIFLMV